MMRTAPREQWEDETGTSMIPIIPSQVVHNASRDRCYIYREAMDGHPTYTRVFARTRTHRRGSGSGSGSPGPGLPIDQHINVFVHVGRHAGHQPHPVVRVAIDALFGRTRRGRREPGIASSIFLYTHFSRGIVDEPIDHVGGGSAIRAMAAIEVREQGPGRVCT